MWGWVNTAWEWLATRDGTVIIAFFAFLTSAAIVGITWWGTKRNIAAMQRQQEHFDTIEEIAKRQADEAEQTTKLTQELNERLVRQLTQQPPTPDAPETGDLPKWELTRPNGKDRYVLRNIGPVRATGVKVYTSAPITRRAPNGMTLDPGQSTSFLMAGSLGTPLPDEIRVHCDQATPVYVPIPSQ